MKYKVGDKVRIKEQLVTGRYYGEFIFINDMEGSLGKEVTITGTLRDAAYYIDLDNGAWKWTDGMIEEIATKEVPLTNGDLVRVIKSTLSADKKKFIGKEYKIKDVRSDKYPYRLEGINFYWFNKEELELVELPEVPIEAQIEELKNTDDSWLGKQYAITYLKGSKYKDAFDHRCKVSSITGKLINIDTPFTGRFFVENLNGALEIILMQSVVEMREVV